MNYTALRIFQTLICAKVIYPQEVHKSMNILEPEDKLKGFNYSVVSKLVSKMV